MVSGMLNRSPAFYRMIAYLLIGAAIGCIILHLFYFSVGSVAGFITSILTFVFGIAAIFIVRLGRSTV